MWKCKCGEMNPDSSSFCQSCGNRKSTMNQPAPQMVQAARAREAAQIEKQAKIERDIKREQIDREKVQQQHKTRIENLANLGLDGYYEYKVLSLLDENGLYRRDSGRVDIIKMTNVLNELGLEGWHLVTAYSNELGKNSSASGVGGMMFGTNSTVDENILIFERFVKIKQTTE